MNTPESLRDIRAEETGSVSEVVAGYVQYLKEITSWTWSWSYNAEADTYWLHASPRAQVSDTCAEISGSSSHVISWMQGFIDCYQLMK